MNDYAGYDAFENEIQHILMFNALYKLRLL